MAQTIFYLINEKWTNPILDLFMAAISNIEIWKPFLVIVALLALILGRFKARACIFCLLVSLLITQQVTNVLKSVVNRPRPKQVQRVRMVELQKASPEFLTLFQKPDIRYSDTTDRHRSGPSFPSGHTTNNTAIAVCLTLFYRKRGALYWIVNALIGYSRIYLGAHWPSDIVATVFLVTGETLVIIVALELLWRLLAVKWMPRLYAKHPSLFRDAGLPSEPQVENLPQP